MMARIRNYIFTGFFILLPAGISIAVTIWLFKAVTNNIFNLLPLYFKNQLIWQIIIRVLIVLIVLILLAVVGIVAKVVFIDKIFAIGNRVLIKIPLFNRIYIGVKQLSQIFLHSDKSIFNNVVLVEYPRRGVYMLGFVTVSAWRGVGEKMKGKTVGVFVPNSPNPTGGMLIFADTSDMIKLDMSVEDGMKFVVSGGIAGPVK